MASLYHVTSSEQRRVHWLTEWCLRRRFNLYFGLKSDQGRKHLWLDLQALVESLLLPDQKLREVRYFTARLRDDPVGEERQATYLDALATYCRKVRRVEGRYQARARSCRFCGARRDYLMGTFAGLIAVAVVATMFMSSEYRRGLIRTTLAASPNRVRVLAAKAIVIGLTAFVVGLAAAAGALISGEYSSGMIRVTLAAMPRRLTVLAAKAALVAGLVLLVSAIAVLASAGIGGLILPGHGFTSASGYPPLSLASGSVLRAVCGSILYLVLLGLLSLGIAAAVREAAVAIGLVLGLLYVFPVVTSVMTSPHWQRHLEQIGPMTAGLDIQATTNLSTLPLTPWQGLGVVALWAAGALLLGGAVLRLRDA